MKFPGALTGLFSKKEEAKEYFFSLYLDVDAAAVAVWNLDPTGIPHVASFAHAVVAEDSWEARIHVVDRLLSAAEDKVGVTKAITKTVFGMPGAYLTAEGNITDAVRTHLNKLCHMLELTPVGFVPISQAIEFSLKKEEGIPPSAILIGCSGKLTRVSLFRVGHLTHDDLLELGDDPPVVLEAALKKYQDSDVLPSRILLYGGNSGVLEDIRLKLLKHPWPTRANFLHFPKIEIIPTEALLTAVSLAGASEIAHDIGENAADDAMPSTQVVAQAKAVRRKNDKEERIDEEVSSATEEEVQETEGGEDAEYGEDETDEEESTEEESVEDEKDGVPDETEVVPEIFGTADKGRVIDPQEEEDAELSNVEMVSPETLGFRREDVLEHVPLGTKVNPSYPPISEKKKISLPTNFKLPTISFAAFSPVLRVFRTLPKFRGSTVSLIAGVVGLVILGFVLYYFIPRATVTVLVSSSSVDESAALSVNTSATVADSASKVIPGKMQEQSVSGEKTIAVTGKKNVGDAAKGIVTIYNKVTSGRSLPKGTVLTGGGVSFTLDGDISVASASETIGSITFGKTTANVTAKDIGVNGNVSASTEFAFANISASSLSARNESAMTGGTSKQVTVVSRIDQDALVKALTEELVAQAKQQLLTSGASGERLIDATIKTEVAEKVFTQELDQEAKELHGKVTVKVSGVSIADSDIKAALASLIEAKVPKGYHLAPEQTDITTSNVSVKKDGSISLTVKLTAVAIPSVDSESLKRALAGQDVNKASAILKATTGVAGAEYRFSLSPITSRLPINSNNITITVMVQ